ncbi:MAG TPA: hypothetical protein VF266_00465 [Thermoanaerobaculia bacterium]
MTALLPISGTAVPMRELSGAEDLLLLGGGKSVPHLVRELLTAVGGAGVEELPVGDVESLLLALRASLLGEHIHAEIACPSKGCRTRIDVSFTVADYLRHHKPRKARGLSADGAWLTDAEGMTFRIPTLRDQVDVSGSAGAPEKLYERCVRGDASPRARRRIERVLDAIAPTLSDYVGGACPECGLAVEVYFDVEQFVLRELRDTAAEVIDDVHLLASRYGWSEADIVALPRSRRTAYAERVRREGAA